MPVAETAGLAGTDGRVVVLPFNDAGGRCAATSKRNHDAIAALLVEPMANRIGLLMPERAFLAEARALCDRYGIVLIFDEVIAFRVGYRGVAGRGRHHAGSHDARQDHRRRLRGRRRRRPRGHPRPVVAASAASASRMPARSTAIR